MKREFYRLIKSNNRLHHWLFHLLNCDFDFVIYFKRFVEPPERNRNGVKCVGFYFTFSSYIEPAKCQLEAANGNAVPAERQQLSFQIDQYFD